MRLDDGGHHDHALGRAAAGGLQHGVGLADAGRGAEEDFQTAAVLPARLRERVSLSKDVALVGMGNRFELWNVADWDRLTDDTLAMDRDALNAALGDFSL